MYSTGRGSLHDLNFSTMLLRKHFQLSRLPQDYIKKLEQERFESDIREAHEVLAHMGSRLHTLERGNETSASVSVRCDVVQLRSSLVCMYCMKLNEYDL